MKRWSIAVIACVAAGSALGLVSACGSSSGPYKPPTVTATPAGAAPGVTASIGQSVTDGNYSFVVNSMQCGVGTLTAEFDTGTPTQGQFCIAVLTMTNITNAPQFTPPEAAMTDTNGNTYETTSDISAKVAAQDIYLGSGFSAQVQVNPGSHYTDTYVYDVPRGVLASTLTLTGSDTSSGTKVSVVGGKAATPASSAPGNSAPAAPAPAAPPAPASSSSGGVSDAGSVVQQYFAAIDAGDYSLAWSLGGKNVSGGSYDSFVQGFSSTSYDAVTILSVNGDTVSINLDATQTDGTHKYFSGTYTVQNGVIVGADIH